jgi:hypothetical protein
VTISTTFAFDITGDVMYPILIDGLCQWRMMKEDEYAYLYSDKPAPAVTTPDVLISLTILSKMHVKMVLHVLLPNNSVCETNSTLFTLSSQLIVQKLYDWRSFPSQRSLINTISYGWLDTYFAMSELVKYICCERIACRYALQDSRSRSTLSCLISSFAVAPAPKGVPLADTTPALRSVDSKFAILLEGGAVEVEGDVAG